MIHAKLHAHSNSEDRLFGEEADGDSRVERSPLLLSEGFDVGSMPREIVRGTRGARWSGMVMTSSTGE